jgi:hypothetical protein
MGAQAFETYWLTDPPSPLENLRSLHCDRLSEITRLIDVRAHHHGRMVGDQLHRDRIDEWRHRGGHARQRQLGQRVHMHVASALGIGDQNDLAQTRRHLLHVGGSLLEHAVMGLIARAINPDNASAVNVAQGN